MTQKTSFHTKPPYFRPKVGKRKRLNIEAAEFLYDIFDVSPDEADLLPILNRMAEVRFERAEGRIVPVGETPFEDHEVRKFAAALTELTRDWGSVGVGPIRSLYYVLCLLPAEQGKLAPVFGGFPPPNEPLSESSEVTDEDLIVVYPREWMVRDLFLEWTLADLNLSWGLVERAMRVAFLAALPVAYRRAMRGYSDPLKILLWPHALAEWQKTREHGGAVGSAIKSMLDILVATQGIHGYPKILEAVGSDLETAHREAVSDSRAVTKEWRLTEHHKQSQPLIKAVGSCLKFLVWDKPRNELTIRIQTVTRGLSQTQAAIREKNIIRQTLAEIPPDASPAVKKILQHRAGLGSQRIPIELWMLIADLVNHCPVIKGLPLHDPSLTAMLRQPRLLPYRSFRDHVMRNTPAKVPSREAGPQ